MNTQLIKTNLIDAISQTNNPVLLLEISKLFDIDIGNSEVVKLTKGQIAELNIAISQIKQGEFLSHSEAKKQSEEWLKD